MESPTTEEPAAVPAVEKKIPHVIIVGAGKLPLLWSLEFAFVAWTCSLSHRLTFSPTLGCTGLLLAQGLKKVS